MMNVFKSLMVSIFLLVLMSNALAQTNRTWYVDSLKDKKTGTGEKADPFRDLQYSLDQAKDGDTIFIFPGTYEAKPEEYVEELCGNCQEHKTRVKATRGFLIQRKSLNIIGSGKENTFLVTNAGYGVLFENSRNSLITRLKVTGGKEIRMEMQLMPGLSPNSARSWPRMWRYPTILTSWKM